MAQLPSTIARRWRDAAIPVKFSIGFSLLILTLVAIAATAYITVTTIRAAENEILRQQEIERLILSIDRDLHRAKHLQEEFFLEFRDAGLRAAFEQYALESIKSAAAAVEASRRLRRLLATPALDAALAGHKIDLNLYLATAKRFADTSTTAYGQVNALAAPEHGLEVRLQQRFEELTQAAASLPGAGDEIRRAAAIMKMFRYSRHPADLQRAINIILGLRRRAAERPGQFEGVTAAADQVIETCRAINTATEAIKSLTHDFHLQEANLVSSGQVLMEKASQAVAEARQRMAATYRTGLIITIFMAVSGLAIAITVVRLLHAGVTLRIRRLTRTARRLRDGDLDVIFHDDSADELGTLARVFTAMTSQRSADIKKLHEANDALRASRATLEQAVAARTAELRNLLRFSTHITATTELGPLYRSCTSLAMELLAFDFSTLMLLDDTGKKLTIHDTIGFPSATIGTFTLVEGQGLSTYVVEHKEAAVVEDFNLEKRFEVPSMVFEHGISSALCVPMMIGETVFGVFIGHTREKRRFTNTQIELFQSFANQAAIAIDNARHLKRLEESERTFRTFFNHANDAILIFSPDGRIIEANEIAVNRSGRKRAELRALTFADLTPADARDLLEKQLAALATQGKAIFETTCESKDGTRTPVEINATMFNHQGQQAFLAVIRDISERKHMEKELQKIGRLESLGVLAGGIAHDFNNILASILGNINLASLDGSLADETRNLLQEAEKASIRAKGLTQQLLTFAKGGAPVKEVSSVEGIIRDCASFALRGTTIRCRFDFAPGLHQVEVDKGQFSQVIQNLVINARHAMPDGGTITIGARNSAPPPQQRDAADHWLEITIRDQGIGIPEQIIDKIFDPYFTTKQQGSGLGLAVCHSIISKHGGVISAASAPGQGTTFTIHLPAVPSPAKEKTAPPTGETTAPASLAHDRPGRVMIMDDEAMVRNITGAMIKRLGYEVVEAKDGEEAIHRYREMTAAGDKVDVVIMDLTIPGGMGGKEAVATILEIDPEARVMVASGYSNDPVMANYREYGFCGAVSKPFRLDELRAVIEDVLSGGG